MEQRHTPLPWDECFIADHEGCGCCNEPFNNLDQEFIVRACNSHYDLIDCLELALVEFGSILNNPKHVPPNGAIETIKTAIAKAKGE